MTLWLDPDNSMRETHANLWSTRNPDKQLYGLYALATKTDGAALLEDLWLQLLMLAWIPLAHQGLKNLRRNVRRHWLHRLAKEPGNVDLRLQIRAFHHRYHHLDHCTW